MRSGNFDVVLEASCNSVVNPLLDVQKYLPNSVFAAKYGNDDDRPEIDLYQSVQPGGGRIRDCVKEHRAQLSEACKAAIAERMLQRRQSNAATNSPGLPPPTNSR